MLSAECLHPLCPIPPSSPHHTPGLHKFSCRTNVSTTSASSSNRQSLSPRLPGASHHSATDLETMLTDAALPSRGGQFSPTHTYLPTLIPPHAGMRAPPSLSTVHTKLDQPARHPHLIISEFVLSPQTHHPTAVAPASEGLFSRALRVLQNNAPTSTTNSFSLSPLPDGPPPTTSTTRGMLRLFVMIWRVHGLGRRTRRRLLCSPSRTRPPCLPWARRWGCLRYTWTTLGSLVSILGFGLPSCWRIASSWGTER